MATTIAALVIVLGLMVDLAQAVRHDASVQLTKQLLRQCDLMMQQYISHHAGQIPAVTPLADASGKLDENSLRERAIENNREFVALLRREAAGLEPLPGLPTNIYDNAILSDAWGSPIVFMPQMQREIGIAPQNRPFFFSAGPDRKYLTQDDNLYSYEETGQTGQTPTPGGME